MAWIWIVALIVKSGWVSEHEFAVEVVPTTLVSPSAEFLYLWVAADDDQRRTSYGEVAPLQSQHGGYQPLMRRLCWYEKSKRE